MPPLEYGLSLDRFLSEDTEAFPDIDLDFPLLAKYARHRERPSWRDLFALAPSLTGIPRGIV